MTLPDHRLRHPRHAGRGLSWVGRSAALPLILALILAAGCAGVPRPELRGDPAAEAIVARLKQTNAGLTRFKSLGRITLYDPGQPVKSFRTAIAGRLDDRLRIDMVAPFGGAAGTVASDGDHLFLVLHPTREYYRKRLGDGSLRRFIHMDVTVGDLLELMVGRIPMNDALAPRQTIDTGSGESAVSLVDRRGVIRQRIFLGASGRPIRSEWFDDERRSVMTLFLDGQRPVDGFVIASRIDLTTASGQRLVVELERYEANVRLDDVLFVPPPL